MVGGWWGGGNRGERGEGGGGGGGVVKLMAEGRGDQEWSGDSDFYASLPTAQCRVFP